MHLLLVYKSDFCTSRQRNIHRKALEEYTDTEDNDPAPTYLANDTDFYFRDPWSSKPLIYKPPFAKGAPNLNDTFELSMQAFDFLASSLTQENFLNGDVNSGGGSAITGPDTPSMLYQAKNVARAMESLAYYMTTSMRPNNSMLLQEAYQNASLIAPEQAVIGKVWVQKQIVIVRWEWLTFPIVLLVLTIMFVLAVLWETASGRVGLWQASPLALFFHARPGVKDFDWRSENVDTVQVMRNAAEKLQAGIPKGEREVVEVYPRDERRLD